MGSIGLGRGTRGMTFVAASQAARNSASAISSPVSGAPWAWRFLRNGTAANAAHTTLTVPAGSSGGGGSGGSGSGGSGGSGGSSAPKATIHVSETLHGRELVVHVSGPATGEVRVSFTGHLGGRTVAWGAKTVALKHGRLTATFKLGPRTAAHATIHVSAKLDHELAVTSTLHRHPRRARRSRRSRIDPTPGDLSDTARMLQVGSTIRDRDGARPWAPAVFSHAEGPSCSQGTLRS